MAKDYSIDADFKSRHRQHNTRRQIQCQHPNLLLTQLPTIAYLNKHQLPKLNDERKNMSSGGSEPNSGFSTKGLGVKRRGSRLASKTTKGMASLNKNRKDGYWGRDWRGIPLFKQPIYKPRKVRRRYYY